MTRLFLFCAALCACHSVTQAPVRQPDGSWHLQCGSALNVCVQQADDLCKDRGYVVLGGLNKRQLYGAELGQSQVAVRESELNVACVDRRGDMPKVISPNQLAPTLPPRAADREPALEPQPPTMPKLPALACTPGATQRCVGSGACSGGQACLASGSGFAPCDCGPATNRSTSP
jgi:hypothetical protein